jgi:Domain of Unknown Function with PDB structure (DUF3857)
MLRHEAIEIQTATPRSNKLSAEFGMTISPIRVPSPYLNFLEIQISTTYNSRTDTTFFQPALAVYGRELVIKGASTRTRAEQLRKLPSHLSTLTLLGAITLTALPAFASKPDSVPDWVRTAAQQKIPDYPPETNAVVLLEDTTYTVASDGNAVEHYRYVVKILRPQGREEGIVAVPFDKDAKILSMHVWSIGPDGHEYAVKDNEMVEYGYPGQGNFFMDLRVRAANAPGRDPGGIVA